MSRDDAPTLPKSVHQSQPAGIDRTRRPRHVHQEARHGPPPPAVTLWNAPKAKRNGIIT